MIWRATNNQNEAQYQVGVFIVIAISCLGGWLVVATMKRLRRHRFGTRWWIAAGLLVLLGAMVGRWAAMDFEYQPCPQARIIGFPVPVAFFILEDDQWTDFVPPLIIQYGAVAADMIFAIAFVLMPLSVCSWILTRNKGT